MTTTDVRALLESVAGSEAHQGWTTRELCFGQKYRLPRFRRLTPERALANARAIGVLKRIDHLERDPCVVAHLARAEASRHLAARRALSEPASADACTS